MQFLGFLFGAGEAEQGRIGGFVSVLIFAGGFAQGGGVAFHVQDVVLDLERQAYAFGVMVQAFGGVVIDVWLA